MIKLVSNELYKILHKKSTFIILIIMVGFALLANIVYKNMGVRHQFIDDYEVEYKEAKDFLANNEINKDNYEDYIFYETIISTCELKDKYKENWQREVIGNDIYQAYYEYYLNSYYGNKEEINKNKENIDILLADLESGNWQNFVERRIANLEKELTVYKEELKGNNSKRNEPELKKQITITEKQIELYKYRIKENLPMGGVTYLDDAITEVNGSIYEVANVLYSNIDKYNAKMALVDYHVNEYILDNKVDINNNQSLRSLLIDFYEEFGFIVLVFVIMVAGAIVSDEYSKGTIKSLLILPYKRSKILLAKLLTMIITIFIAIIAMLIIELIVGGIIFGFSSLSIPYVTYNIATESIVTMNIFKYFGLMTIAIIPKILLLGTLAFALSTIVGNTAAAVAITFSGYIGEVIVNNIALRYDVKFLNYFVTTNWNFSEFLFGGRSMFKLSLTHGIIICLIYFAFMVIVAFIIFKKKDIKNI